MSDQIQTHDVEALPVERVVEYDPIEAGLAELRARYGGRVYDCSDSEQDREARAARNELSKLNGRLDATHKAVKEPALRRCQFIDSIKRRIASEIATLRDPIDAQIKAEDARKAQAEAKRVADIQKRISTMLSLDMQASTLCSSNDLSDALDRAREFDPGDELEEFKGQAIDMRASRIAELQGLLEKRQAMDAEAARLEAEREELARKQAEEAARLAAERARIDDERRELARVAEEKRKADDARLAEERRRNDEALAAERARLRSEAEAARKSLEAEEAAARERNRQREKQLADERARFAREQAEALAQKERERAAQLAKRERFAIAGESMLSALRAVAGDSGWATLGSGTRSMVERAISDATVESEIIEEW